MSMTMVQLEAHLQAIETRLQAKPLYLSTLQDALLLDNIAAYWRWRYEQDEATLRAVAESILLHAQEEPHD